MPCAERRRFLVTFRDRLIALQEDDLVFRAPLVHAQRPPLGSVAGTALPAGCPYRR
jgi:hypothetical protein